MHRAFGVDVCDCAARAYKLNCHAALAPDPSDVEFAVAPINALDKSANRESRTRDDLRLWDEHIDRLDDVLVKLSKCCTPVPGDDIMGFVTKGRGVSVHRVDCANALSLVSEQTARVIDVEWANLSADDTFIAAVEVVALDRTRLLRDVANALSDQRVNIVSCTTQTGNDRVARMRFEFEFSDPSHLQAMLRMIKNIDGVYDAFRLLPGADDSRATGNAHPSHSEAN
ncbi:MAG: bifunctional (p)ppGpp synthetase/guanosine-3',5'-bis(diphosphate) 3'-pyrophosphohydrolase [Actinobacteria bacterium]|nr:bifunctional (p)ppGpp synthetase/guanosine-3',5'-bis(diphosphate) 3'-pyrophosphohydrolase [Actinomycetota bacterium]